MTLTRRTENDGNLAGWLHPFRELEEMRQQMAKLFDGGSLVTADWAPAIDASETETEYRIRAALPDVKKEDVKVTLEDGVLAIQGERKSRKEEKNEKLHRVEIQQGSFYRSLSMPSDADPERVSAKYDNGVLDVTIQRTAPKKPAGRPITVR